MSKPKTYTQEDMDRAYDTGHKEGYDAAFVRLLYALTTKIERPDVFEVAMDQFYNLKDSKSER